MEGQNDRVPALAADLVRRQVTVIVAASTPASLAVKAATQTIPIVFVVGTDPVGIGLVASLAHPGGNITGATNLNVELFKKCFELTHSLMSPASTIAVLVNPLALHVAKFLQIFEESAVGRAHYGIVGGACEYTDPKGLAALRAKHNWPSRRHTNHCDNGPSNPIRLMWKRGCQNRQQRFRLAPMTLERLLIAALTNVLTQPALLQSVCADTAAQAL